MFYYLLFIPYKTFYTPNLSLRRIAFHFYFLDENVLMKTCFSIMQTKTLFLLPFPSSFSFFQYVWRREITYFNCLDLTWTFHDNFVHTTGRVFLFDKGCFICSCDRLRGNEDDHGVRCCPQIVRTKTFLYQFQFFKIYTSLMKEK